jgi:hypothetical protein
MKESHEFGVWRICAWNGPLFMGVFVYFWGWLGHNFPPFQPDVPASQIAEWFRTEANWIRLGMVVAMTFAVTYCVWGLAIGRVMEHVTGRNSLLVELAKWGAGLTVVPVLVSTSFWLTGAFRPEALPDWALQLLYDMAWLLIDLSYAVTSVQLFAIGAGFLRDKRAVPLIPRWMAWYSIWVGFMFVAECLMPYFRNGAFARNGILNFWIEFMIWVLWVPVFTFYILGAIGRIEKEIDSGA